MFARRAMGEGSRRARSRGRVSRRAERRRIAGLSGPRAQLRVDASRASAVSEHRRRKHGDVYVSVACTGELTRALGNELRVIGASGHINGASGYGPWPEGEAMLVELLK